MREKPITVGNNISKEKYYLKKCLYTIKKIPNFHNDTMKSK
jgi:hypothetical protein